MFSPSKIHKVKPQSFARKQFLNPLAQSLGLEPREYANKKQLVAAILNNTYANSRDPVTLQDVADIPYSRLITWEQDGKKFAADVASMYHIVQSGNTVNPWTIDVASGISQAANPDEYASRFDLRNVPQLLETIEAKYHALEIEDYLSLDCVPTHVKHRHSIERVCKDLYISHIIDWCEKTHAPRVARFVLSAISHVIVEYEGTLHVTGVSLDESTLQTLANLDQVRIGLTTALTAHTGLTFAAEFFDTCANVFDTSVNERIFDTLDKIITRRA